MLEKNLRPRQTTLSTVKAIKRPVTPMLMKCMISEAWCNIAGFVKTRVDASGERISVMFNWAHRCLSSGSQPANEKKLRLYF